MKKRKNEEFFKSIDRSFKDNFYLTGVYAAIIMAVLLSIYFLVAVIIYNVDGSDFWSFLVVIIVIPLTISLVAPFLYSYYACNSALLNPITRDEVKISSFFKTARFEVSYPQWLQLRIWSNLFNSFLIYLGLSFLLAMIASIGMYNFNSDFRAIIDEVYQSETVDSLLSTLYESDGAFIDMENIVSFISLFFAAFYFFHRIAVNFFKYHLAQMLLGVPNALIDGVFKSTIRNNRKLFYPGYYRIMWPLILAYSLLSPAVFFGFYYSGIGGLDVSIISLSAIFFPLVVVLPFLPRLFNYYNLIWPMWSNLFTSNLIKSLRMNAGNLKHRAMSDEESDQIDEYEKNIEDIEKKLKDHDDKKK
jgi:hypothetical protein